MSGQSWVALSSPIVAPLALSIYTAAWMAVLLTPLAVLHAVRFTGGRWARSREILSVAVLLILTIFSLYEHIAGTTLAF